MPALEQEPNRNGQPEGANGHEDDDFRGARLGTRPSCHSVLLVLRPPIPSFVVSVSVGTMRSPDGGRVSAMNWFWG